MELQNYTFGKLDISALKYRCPLMWGNKTATKRNFKNIAVSYFEIIAQIAFCTYCKKCTKDFFSIQYVEAVHKKSKVTESE